MKLLTQAYILENYGVRLTMPQLARLLELSEGTIRNQVSAETFPIPTYKKARHDMRHMTPLQVALTRCRRKRSAAPHNKG